jgi:hypothetical protein
VTPTFDPIAPFLDAIPVDGRTVLREAIRFARNERRMQVRLFSKGAKSIFECAVEGLAAANAREESRRRNQAASAWTASLDPLERERVALELEMTLLRDKLIGSHAWDRERITSRMAAYSRRLAEIGGMQNKRRAA